MRKNISLLFFVLILTIFFVNAQKNPIDSLKQLLSNEKQDTGRVLLLSQLIIQYRDSRPDTVPILANEGLALSRQIKFRNGEAICLKALGHYLTETGDYPKALGLDLEALKIFEEEGNELLEATTLDQVAYVHYLNKNFIEARRYLFRELTIFQNLHSESHLAFVYGNLGDNYEKSNMLDSARYYTNLSYNLALKLNDARGIAFELGNLGNLYTKMGQDAIALDFYRASTYYLNQRKEYDAYCEATLGMATVFKRSGNIDSCLHYAKLSYRLAQNSGFPHRIIEASNFLTDYYKSIHQVDSAFVYQSATMAAKDSAFSQEKARQLQNISFNEALRQQQIEAEKAQLARERSDNIQYAILAIGLVCFTVIFLLLTQSIIVNEKWIRFLGILGLLLLFEFIDLFIHPYLSEATHHSPIEMLLVLVIIAALLIPLHHRLEHWITHKMVAKNKRIRLAAAKKTVAKLEGDG